MSRSSLFLRTTHVFLCVILLSGMVFPYQRPAQAADETGGTKQEIDALNQQVKNKQNTIKELDSTIGKYKGKIAQNEAAVNTLQNEVALLENRIQEKRLSTQRTKSQIELVNLEVQRTGVEIAQTQEQITRRQESLGELIRQLQEADGVSLFDTFLARPSLSDFFTRLDELKRVEAELANATKDVRQIKQAAEQKKIQQEAERVQLQAQKELLITQTQQLDQDLTAKLSLIEQTENNEEEYQRILYELRQQQQGEADEIADLQHRLQERLDAVDEALARGDVLLNWPVKVKYISAKFHDPTYPFRKLFEHPGIDLPIPVGTPVKAAAGGYVAWNKTGKQYGNYVMVVHPGGIATVYAHLSAFGPKPDTYVERGDVIGYSGGRSGDPGAGLSTGPHLHFEVRQNGIPVNPASFLPSVE